MIKLIIFDAGHILYNPENQTKHFRSEIARFLKRNGAKNIESLDRNWGKISPLTATGRISMKEARARLLSKLGLSRKLVEEYERIDRSTFDKLELMEIGIKDVLYKLRKRGYKLAVLSDTGHDLRTKKIKLDAVGIPAKLFDKIFVSSEIGHTKPDREAYRMVLNHFRVRPNETVFVGHDADELEGAKKVGIIAISYKGDPSGDFSIRRFNQILKIVKELDAHDRAR